MTTYAEGDKVPYMNTAPTTVRTEFRRRTLRLGWVRVYGNYNEDTAITIARHFVPKGWDVDTGADWSDDYGCWVVPAYVI